jgi:hypothetical protein
MTHRGTIVSAENKALARHVAAAFGGRPRAQEYLHDAEPLGIDLVVCEGRPSPGLTSYATLGLSDTPMRKDGEEFPTRVELVGIMETTDAAFANVLAAAAFRVMRGNEFVYPGRVFAGYVAEYFPDAHLPHVYLTTPYPWEDALRSTRFGAKLVSWLLAVPISESELAYLREHGDAAFEELLEAQNAQIMTLARPPVV